MKIKKTVGVIAIVMALALIVVAITGVLNIAKDRDKNDESEETTVPSVTEPAQNMITFTIDGIQFSCLEGMTWGEFIGSEYDDSASKNIIFGADGETIEMEGSDGATGTLANPSGVSGAGGEYVLCTDVIINGYAYWNMT